MKVIIFSLIFNLTVFPAMASGKYKLICGENAFITVKIEVESDFDLTKTKDEESYFNFRNGFLQNNYAMSHAFCAGHSLKNLGCVGFWFDNKNFPVQADFSMEGKNIQVQTVELNSNSIVAPINLSCRWQK